MISRKVAHGEGGALRYNDASDGQNSFKSEHSGDFHTIGQQGDILLAKLLQATTAGPMLQSIFKDFVFIFTAGDTCPNMFSCDSKQIGQFLNDAPFRYTISRSWEMEFRAVVSTNKLTTL